MSCALLGKRLLPWPPKLPSSCFHLEDMKGKKAIVTKIDIDVETKVVKLEALEKSNFLLQILHPSN